jgi:hypothetical protein
MMFTSPGVDAGERRVERGGLARAGGAGDEHHAVRVADRLEQLALGPRLDAERLEVEREVALVEDAEHHLLAEQRGERRHAEVDDLLPHLELDAPVLRHAPLGDVEGGEDLEARDERRLELHRRLHDLVQRAVDAEAHAHLVLEALDVHVARPALHRLGEDGVDEPHHRRLVDGRGVEAAGAVVLGVLEQLDVAVGAVDLGEQRLHLALRLLVGGLVVLLDEGAERELARDDRIDVVAGDELEVVDDAGVARVDDGHGERAPLALEREHRVLHRQLGGDELEHARVDLEARQVDGGQAVLPGERLGELDLGDEAELDQTVAQAPAGLLLLREGARELLARDEPLADEELAQALAVGGEGDGGCGHGGGRRDGRREGGRSAGCCAGETIQPLPRYAAASRGRHGRPPKVTSGASRRSSPGPMPGTRLSPAIDPNAPRARRSATMRRASAGPMPGSASSAAESAWSASTGPAGAGGGRRAARRPGARRGSPRRPVPAVAEFPPPSLPPLGRRLARAESTAASWRSSAWRSSAAGSPGARGSGGTPSPAARAPAPRAARPAKKARAFRSAGVMRPRYGRPAPGPRRGVAGWAVVLQERRAGPVRGDPSGATRRRPPG